MSASKIPLKERTTICIFTFGYVLCVTVFFLTRVYKYLSVKQGCIYSFNSPQRKEEDILLGWIK